MSTDAETFVKIWQASDSIKDVCDALGMNYQAAARRATFYREKGVNLKYMRRARPSLDVDALNAMIEKLG